MHRRPRTLLNAQYWAEIAVLMTTAEGSLECCIETNGRLQALRLGNKTRALNIIDSKNELDHTSDHPKLAVW